MYKCRESCLVKADKYMYTVQLNHGFLWGNRFHWVHCFLEIVTSQSKLMATKTDDSSITILTALQQVCMLDFILLSHANEAIFFLEKVKLWSCQFTCISSLHVVSLCGEVPICPGLCPCDELRHCRDIFFTVIYLNLAVKYCSTHWFDTISLPICKKIVKRRANALNRNCFISSLILTKVFFTVFVSMSTNRKE